MLIPILFLIMLVSPVYAQTSNSWDTITVDQNQSSDFLVARQAIVEQIDTVVDQTPMLLENNKTQRDIIYNNLVDGLNPFIDELKITKFVVICNENNNKDYLQSNLMYVEVIVEYDNAIVWHIELGFEKDAPTSKWITSCRPETGVQCFERQNK